MSFLRHTEIYQSDEIRERRRVRPFSRTLAHRLDESPSRLFLGRLLSSIACLRFTDRLHCARISQSRQSLLCRALRISLTCGLTQGAHPNRTIAGRFAWPC